eukprot:TRINITY_DN29404_c0_g1_i1.p1 TRINITY_DN29404_c0_g1~~TRINITY_DN29404_c0_g1_i1.p1  ORF type:complete len:180 (-),score=32.07 TRINITY_DN29404_c0_g1_i1:459-998(-)
MALCKPGISVSGRVLGLPCGLPSIFCNVNNARISLRSFKRIRSLALVASAKKARRERDQSLPSSPTSAAAISMPERTEEEAARGVVEEEAEAMKLPGNKSDFWEGPQWDAFGFVIQYLWAFGVVFALIACGIAVRTYNYGATDFKETPVYKEAIESQGLFDEPTETGDSQALIEEAPAP